ncbi:MAG: hypothetical protein ACW99Q_13055, partial [Candidatus Kariarchaeaceae archaeon]
YSIRSFIEYDFETQESTQKLVIESWNPSTDETVLYYTFANGTRVYIEDDTATKIYTLKFDNLLVSGTDLEYLSETQFHSFQWYATMEDVGGGFYNYTFPLVNGSKLEIKSTLLDEVYDDNLNINVYLTNYCSIVDTTDIQLEDKVYYLNLYQFDGNKLELARQLEVEHANPRYHWLTESYYVVDASTGERFYFEKNSTWTDEQYCNSVCGLTAEYLMNVSNIIYVVGEGRERIEGIFTVTDLNLDANPFNVLDRYAFNIYYVKGSPTISLLPTHSTPARSYSDLFYTTSNPDHPGLVPVKKTVTINDEIVDLTLLVDGWELKFEDETTEIVPLDSVKADDLLLIIDRQNYWNASSTGFSIQYGKLHPYENRLTDIFGSLDVITPIDENGFHQKEFIQRNVEYALNDTDLTRIEFVRKPLGQIFEINVNNSVLVNSTRFAPLYNSTGGYYYFPGLRNEIYVVNPSDNYTYLNTFFYQGIEGSNDLPGSEKWVFNLDGQFISYYEWNLMNYYESWFSYIRIGQNEYVLNSSSQLVDTLYNFTYGIPSGGNNNTYVGWFSAYTQNSFGDLNQDYYTALFDATTFEVYRVNNTDVITLWKVRLNGSKIVYTPNSGLYYHEEDYETGELLYYYVYSYNGSLYNFTKYEDLEFLGEIHFYPTGEYPNQIINIDGQLVNISDPTFELHEIWGQNYITKIENQIVELTSINYWLPNYSIFYLGELRPIFFENEYILHKISHYGYPYGKMYVPDENIHVEKIVWNIIVGNPRYNRWGYNIWDKNLVNGALDIDGDFTTTTDQFYVRRYYQTTTSLTSVLDYLGVNIMWDPNTTTYDNEYFLNSTMGINTFTHRWEWSELFIWYYAKNFTQISTEALSDLKTKILDGDESAPGYWGVGWLLNNRTWEDIIDEADENNWDWLSSNEQSYTWLDFSFNQSYYTFTDETGEDTWIFNQLKSSWSGLWIYEDANDNGLAEFNQDEITHTLIPKKPQDKRFITPGIAFGNDAISDSIELTSDEPNFNNKIDFGVQFFGVNGSLQPTIKDIYGVYASYWNWQMFGVPGSEYNSFSNRPTNITIDEIAFIMHFDIETIVDEDNAKANLKLDQKIGNWNVDAPGGKENLEGKSLATSYFMQLGSSADYNVSDTAGETVSNEAVVPSDLFSFGTSTIDFASALLSGNYNWAKDTSLAVSSTSYTMPIGQFQIFYESDDEELSVGKAINLEMYFLAIGFPEWDGFSVFQDPVYAAYSAVKGADATSYAPTITESPGISTIEVEVGTTVELSWVAMDEDPYLCELIDENDNVLTSSSWLTGYPVLISIQVISGIHNYRMVFYDQTGHKVLS